MNKKIGAGSLLLVAVGGLTASGAASAAEGEQLGATVRNTFAVNGPTSTASSAILSGANGDSLSVIKELSYGDQEKIYKDLTTKGWDLAGIFTGEKLTSTNTDEIYKQLSELRGKNENKFDNYMDNNYALNSLVNDWDENGVKELLNKLNKKDEDGKDPSNIYTKKYLVQNPFDALDIAYNNNSNLVGGVDRSALIKKVEDNKKYLGIDSSTTIDNMTLSGIGALVSNSAKSEYAKLLADSINGEGAGVSKTLKAKYYAKQGACWAAATAIFYGVYRAGEGLFNKITGKKTKKVVATPEDGMQKEQNEADYIFTPYTEESDDDKGQFKQQIATPVVKTPGANSKTPAVAVNNVNNVNNVKKSKAMLSKNKDAQNAASFAKSKAPAVVAVDNDAKMS